MKMRRQLGWLLLILSAGCSSEKETLKEVPGKQQLGQRELVIAATGNFHAALDRAEGLASVIRDLRKRYGRNMVYLDSGDQFLGSFEGSIGKGRAVVEFFNLLQPDAAAIGNHEFDYGPDVSSRVSVQAGDDGMGNLKKRVEDAKFPMLSANLILDPPVSCEPGPTCNAQRQQTVFAPRAVIDSQAGKVGVIGVTSPLTRNITNPAFLKGTRFLELSPVIAAEAAWLRDKEGCEWVLLVASEGLRYESDGKTLKGTGLASVVRQLPASTVDAVIGNQDAPAQEAVHGTPVLQTGRNAEKVGVLRLIRGDSGLTYRFEPWIPVPDTAVAFDVTDQLMLYRNESLKFKRRITGTAEAPFLFNKTSESALGNLVADALRQADSIQADFALINAGAIRTNIPAGRISNENVFRVLPFDDSLVVVELDGRQMRALLEVACSGALGQCSVSGLQLTLWNTSLTQVGPWERDLNGDEKKEEWERNLIADVRTAGGEPLSPDRTYRLATISYLVEGGDYQDIVYDKIAPERIHYYQEMLIRDVLAAYMQKHSPLRPARYYSLRHPRILFRPPSSSAPRPGM